MKQVISRFEQDDESDWLARLECGHAQHVRHRPPQEERPWVLSNEGRKKMVGTALDCQYCDMPRLPDGLRQYWKSPIFTQGSVPKGLLKDHQTKEGCWGVIRVFEGKLLYEVSDGQNWTLRPGVDGVIEPEAKHHVRPLGDVRFQVVFYRVPVEQK